MKASYFFSIILIFCAGLSFSQVKSPQPSPSCTVKQAVGLSEATIDYSRPSVKGRTIFGSLVPFDELWRTGANGSTDITFSSDFTFGGKSVPAGTYSIYSVPSQNQWDVLLYNETEHWGTPQTFNDAAVVALAKVKPVKTNQKIETFTIEFDNLTNDGADLVIAWDDTIVKVPITVNTKDVVQKSIEQTLAGPTANDYFSAARFYYEEGMDMNQAYDWIKKATTMNPEAFWMLRVQAEMEAKMGNYKQAIDTAKKSLQLAEKAGNMQYVGFNKDNIAVWSKK